MWGPKSPTEPASPPLPSSALVSSHMEMTINSNTKRETREPRRAKNPEKRFAGSPNFRTMADDSRYGVLI